MTNNTLVEAKLNDFETTGTSTHSNFIVSGGGSGSVEVYIIATLASGTPVGMLNCYLNIN